MSLLHPGAPRPEDGPGRAPPGSASGLGRRGPVASAPGSRRTGRADAAARRAPRATRLSAAFLIFSVLTACAGAPEETGVTNETGLPGVAAGFEDPLDPDGEHILASSLVYLEGSALVELRPDLSQAWSHDLGPEAGAQGAARLADGSTVYAFSGAPPAYRSRFERIDAAGELVWSYDELVAIGFVHGVLPTPAGDYIGLDTVAGDIISFDEAGTPLWSLSVVTEDRDFHPNGMHLRDFGDGDVRLVVSMLERSSADLPDAVAVYRLGARDEQPTLAWSSPALTEHGDGAWTHGPRLLEDGTVLVCHSATGQVVAYDGADGAELWRAPPTGEPAVLAFPRDVLPLSDGSWVIADAAAEIVRVTDPRGAFQVVAATPAPGVFGLSPITCGPDGGLPCLGAR